MSKIRVILEDASRGQTHMQEICKPRRKLTEINVNSAVILEAETPIIPKHDEK
jgi:hypothetical protein